MVGRDFLGFLSRDRHIEVLAQKQSVTSKGSEVPSFLHAPKVPPSLSVSKRACLARPQVEVPKAAEPVRPSAPFGRSWMATNPVRGRLRDGGARRARRASSTELY